MTASQNITPSRQLRGFEWLTQVNTDDPVEARRGRVTAALLPVGLVIIVLTAIAQLIASRTSVAATILSVIVSLVVMAGIFAINRGGHTSLAGMALSALVLIANFVLFKPASDAMPGPAILILPVLLGGLLAPPWWAFVIAVAAVIGHAASSTQINPDFLSSLASNPTPVFTIYGNLLVSAFAVWMFSGITGSAIQEGAQTSQTLAQRQQALEVRAATQSRYLQATTTIARAIVGARDLDKLLDDAVRLILETFDYYHVQVFLVDDDREYAVLRSSTGEAGAALLARGHRLPVGSLSVIGQVTSGGRPVIARDTDADVVHKRNELLPLTRSEMALPIQAGDQVIGALDLQSVEPNAFHEDVIPTLQALADQLGVAIENARLFTQTQTSLRELEELYGEVTERSWAEFLAAAREQEKRQIYGPETTAIQTQRSAVVQRVLGAGSVILSTGADGRQAFLAAPVVVRNEVVGVLGVEPDSTRDWTQDDLLLIQSIAERTALAVENARLYLQAQRAADRERLVNTIASRLQRAPNLALLLQSAAQELAQALGTDNVYAEISLGQPLAPSRQDVSDADSEAVEGEARPSAEPLDADASEEARA